MTATGNQGTLDRAAGALSRGLARKFTRRSVLSKVGKYGVALSLGAAGVALLDDEAWACTNCCASNGDAAGTAAPAAAAVPSPAGAVLTGGARLVPAAAGPGGRVATA